MQKTQKGIFSKRTGILCLSFLFIFLFRFIPAPEGLPQAGMQVLGIFIGCLILWLTISIDWPSLLCLLVLGLMQEVGFKEVLLSSFGNATFAFLMFTFLCTYALSKTPFLRRCALFFIKSDLAQKSPWYFVISFFMGVIIIGCFISPTVLFVIFLPVLEEIYEILGLKKGDRVAQMLMIGLVACTSISSGMTPIAHVFTLIAMNLYQAATGVASDYAGYMMAAIPVGLISVGGMLALFKYVYRPDFSAIKSFDVSSMKSEGKMNRREISVVLIFGVVCLLWVLPSLVKSILPEFATLFEGYGTAMPPLLGAVALSVLTYDGEPLLDFKEGMAKGVPWGSLVMASATLVLGGVMTNQDIGITTFLSENLAPIASNLPTIGIIALFITWAAVQTNLSSNMVTATVVTSIAIPIIISSNGAIHGPALASLVGMTSAYAFATPPAMPHVAIAGGSGWAGTKDIFIYGTLIMIIGIVVTVCIGYPIASMTM